MLLGIYKWDVVYFLEEIIYELLINSFLYNLVVDFIG